MLPADAFAELKLLNTRNQAWAAWATWLSHAAVAAAAIVVLCATKGAPYHWPVACAATLLIGTRLRALNNVVHECSHGIFARDRRTNAAIGQAGSALLLASFSAYKRDHFSHHRHLGDYARDRDFGRLEKFAFHRAASAGEVLRHLGIVLSLVHLPSYVSTTIYNPDDPAAVNAARYAWTAALVASALAWPAEFALAFALPFFVVFPTINYLVDYVDHGGLYGREDPLRRTRNFAVPRLLQPLLFPRHDDWHLLHHMLPWLATEHFPRAHAILRARMPEYAVLRHTAAERVRIALAGTAWPRGDEAQQA